MNNNIKPTVTFFSNTKNYTEKVSYVRPLQGNYTFDTTLTNFGMIKERKFRKVNRLSSVLKLAEVKDTNSIYPMLDEFGYAYSDFFIFKSTWDLEYYIEINK